jgi:hypothetical protein
LLKYRILEKSYLIFYVSGQDLDGPKRHSKSSCSKSSCNFNFLEEETNPEQPSKLSEEIIKLLISIFHKLNKRTEQFDNDSNSSPKLSISCISSKSIEFKPSPSHAGFNSADDAMRQDKGLSRFTNITSDSFDISRFGLYIPEVRRLRYDYIILKLHLHFSLNIVDVCIGDITYFDLFLKHNFLKRATKLFLCCECPLLNQ